MVARADGPAPAPLPTGRGVELVLLAFAAALVTGALVLVEANQKQQLSQSLLFLGLAYLGLFGIAHLAVRRFAPYADPLILPAVALLNGLGLVMIHRLDFALTDKTEGRIVSDLATRQVTWTAVGLVVFVAVLWWVKDHRVLARYAYTAGLAGLLLLALPGVLPESISGANGAKLWVRVGPVGIQPGEFAKILMIVFFAALLVQKRDLFSTAGRRLLRMELPRPRDLAPLLVAWGLAIGVLVLERDLGTSLLIFGVMLTLLYTATERVSWVLIGVAFLAGACFLAYELFGHVRVRVLTWLDPFAQCPPDPSVVACFDRRGYQLAQGLFGLGTGGLGGTGLGAGSPAIVPEAESDFMLTSLGEELGLIGLTAIMVLYLVLITRGLRSALALRDSFGKLLTTGLAFTLALQCFIVIGGVTRLIPLTGLTLPFLSYGGSSLVANYALIALLLRVSNSARAPLPAKPAVPKVPIAEAGTELVERQP